MRAREKGDSSGDLDYYDESSLVLPDSNSTITGDNGVAANLELPPLGYAAVYRLGTGACLGANKAIVIDTSPPFVVQVRCAVCGVRVRVVWCACGVVCVWYGVVGLCVAVCVWLMVVMTPSCRGRKKSQRTVGKVREEEQGMTGWREFNPAARCWTCGVLQSSTRPWFPGNVDQKGGSAYAG